MNERNPPALAGGFTHSGMPTGRRHSEARGEVSTAAAIDLRNFFEKKFLKNFQKTFSFLFYSSSVGDSSSSAFGTVVNPAQVCPSLTRITITPAALLP